MIFNLTEIFKLNEHNEFRFLFMYERAVHQLLIAAVFFGRLRRAFKLTNCSFVICGNDSSLILLIIDEFLQSPGINCKNSKKKSQLQIILPCCCLN
jgi:hypothetical protein